MRLRDARDEDAWAEFSAVYEPVIYRMTCRRLTAAGRMQDAEAREVVQEVLIAVAAAIDRFDPDHPSGSFRGWLSRVTRNATIDRLRRLSAQHETAGDSTVARKLDQAAAESSQEAKREFDSDRRKQLFRWAASRIRQRTGETNWMAFWKTAAEGRSIASVARELEISEGKVYVARCRILKRIRDLVHQRESE